jgi:hypothetical protein
VVVLDICQEIKVGSKNLNSWVEDQWPLDKSITIIEGKGNIDIHVLPTFHNVLFVNGLKADLRSISQFHNENHNMHFSKDEYNMYNYTSKYIMKGTKILDNYYEVSTLTTFDYHKGNTRWYW